tara:strand:- start:8995 stop:9729 length:735 start_codon:yes stop_codon:yes gene_type:complete
VSKLNLAARLKLYEKLYTQEVERRDRIQARLNFPLAILLAFSGLASFIIQNIPSLEGIYAYSFWILFGIAIAATLTSFIFLSRVLIKYSDCLVASPEKMEEYYIELEDYNGKSQPFTKLTDKKFAQYLLNTFRDAGTKMGNSNDQRSENLYTATVSIIIAIAAILLSLVPFYLADNLKPTFVSRSFTCQNKNHHLHHPVPAMSEAMFLSIGHHMCQDHQHLGHHLRHPQSRQRFQINPETFPIR